MAYSINKIKCPFSNQDYYRPERRTIKCEGCIKYFSSREKKEEHFKKYCLDQWKECPYAKKLNEAYEEDAERLVIAYIYLEEQQKEFYELYRGRWPQE